MSTLVADPVAVRAWSDDEKLWLELSDGRVLGVPLGFFPRLLHANGEDRNRLEISGGGRSLHWDHLDEDIGVAGLLAGRRDNTRYGREHQAACAACRASSGVA
jgi:hypothetical protein